jgi:sulfur carrier protein ThiS
MSTTLQSARGASAFTQADSSVETILSSRSRNAAQTSAFTWPDPDEQARAETWHSLIDQLLRIRNLQDDWDGEGTEAPHPALVDRAITLAQYLQANGFPPAERVIAGVNGTIYFEWHTPLGYQEIEVLSPMDAECRWVRKGSNVTEVNRLV